MKNDSIVSLSSVDLSTITGGIFNTPRVLSAMGVTEEDVVASARAQGWNTPTTYAKGADRAAGKIRENLVGGGDGFGAAVVDRFTTGWKF
jgi:hypothetical protein